MSSKNDILTELQELNSPLAGYPRTMPYALPENYFATVEAQLTDSIQDAQPQLAGGMPYALPSGYFEKLPGQILLAAKQSAAPVIIKPRHNRILPVIRWAVAAILVLAIGLGSYRIFTPQLTIQQQLNNIPYEDILAYVQYNLDDYETDNIINNFEQENMFTLPAGNINRQAIDDYLQQAEQ